MICEFAKNIYDVELDCAFWSESDIPFARCCCPGEFSHARKNGKSYTGICPGYIPSGQFDQYKDIVIAAIKNKSV